MNAESLSQHETSDEDKDARNSLSKSHVFFLDHARGAAIVLVLGYHFRQLLEFDGTEINYLSVLRFLTFPLTIGWVGVPIFFVISGFCIHLSHAKSKEKRWATFFERRFFRIYPPYLISFLLCYILFLISKPSLFSSNATVQFITHIFLINNFTPNSPPSFAINPALWSIAVEVQLYALYPLLLFTTRRLGWNRSFVLFASLALISIYLPTVRFRLGLSSYLDCLQMGPFRFWLSWAIGAKIADDWLKKEPIFLSNWPLWIPFVIFFASCLATGKERFSFTLGSLAAGTAISHLLTRPELTNRIVRNPMWSPLRVIGLCSYSLYLLHQPCLIEMANFSHWRVGHQWTALCLLTEIPFILLVAWGFYRLVELPSIQLGKKLGDGARVAPDGKVL